MGSSKLQASALVTRLKVTRQMISCPGRILYGTCPLGTLRAHLLDRATSSLKWVHGLFWDVGRREISEHLEKGSSAHAQRQEHRCLQSFYYQKLRCCVNVGAYRVHWDF